MIHKAKFNSLSLILSFLFFSANLYAQEKEANHSLFLLSNLESLSANSPMFDAVQDFVNQEKDGFTILINGDFVDDNGLGTSSDQKDIDKLDRLIALVKDKGEIIFIPGDREWDNSGKKGLKKVKALEKYLESKMGKGEIIFPQKGCLGPEIIDIGKHLRIIAVNSQWFVQGDKRPNEEDADCGLLNENEFWGELEDVLEDAENRNIIVAYHHPALSYGQYAGYKLLGKHFVPPIIGSAIASYHQNIGGLKDLNNSGLKHFSNKLLTIAEGHPGVIFVSGHEYDTQLLYKDGNYHINSGAFAKSRPVARGKETIYKQKKRGFTKLLFEGDGQITFQVYNESDQNKFQAGYERTLFTSPCVERDGLNPTNILYNPCKVEKSVEAFKNPHESGTAIAGDQYAAGILKQLVLGKHYRSAWITPVADIPYLDLDTVHGGLIPYARGGGAQTMSVKFKAANGNRFAFRVLDKNATQRMDRELTVGIYGKLSQDFTSHQLPYGSIIATALMDHLDLPHSMPTLYLMPDSPKLGVFRETFAGKFGTFELKPKGKKKKKKGYRGADKVVSTMQMYRKLIDDNDHTIDVKTFARARIFDMLLSDRDRHIKNWKWLGYKGEEGFVYTPFAKDRDKAFSVLHGAHAIMNVFRIYPDRVSFSKKYKGIQRLNYKNKSMDRWLLTSFTEEDWKAEAKEIQSIMTDEVIDAAILKMPPEIVAIEGASIAKKLKARRDKLPEAIDSYYKMLAKYIDLIGSNSRELFELDRLENGDVQVKIFNLKKNGDTGRLLFDRLIKRAETKEIRLHGLGKKDRFVIKGESSKSILIRIIGGTGEDTIIDESKVKGSRKMTRVYDKRNKDKLTLNSEAKKVKTLEVITFKSDAIFDNDAFKVLPALSFNQDDGLTLGMTANIVKRRFNKPDFSRKYNIRGSVTTNQNYNFSMDAMFRHVWNKWNLMTNISIASNDKSFRQFYGLGNETVIDEDLRSFGFYENETSSVGFEIGLNQTFWRKSSFSFSGVYDFRDVRRDTRDGLEESIYDVLPDNGGLGEIRLLGPKLNLNIDLRNDNAFPTKGMQIKVNNFTFFNVDTEGEMGGRLESEISGFITKGIKLPITLSLRGGLTTAYGESPFYYKSYLGQQNNHRGFLRNRFGGNTSAYINSDLRFHFGTLVTPLVPLKYGIFGLYDVGRVWVETEDSDAFHTAYGGGVYIIPYDNNFNLTFTVAKSDERDFLFSFRVGFFVR